MTKQTSIIVAITGASGAIYGKKFLDKLLQKECFIYLIISENASKIFENEIGIKLNLYSSDDVLKTLFHKIPENVTYYRFDQMDSPVASGSSKFDAMVVIPCSMGTLGRIANGISSNLIERAGDVCLKQRRKLIVVPRETPINLIHIQNMKKLAIAGAVILPASPGFYHKPKTVDDLVDFVVDRVLEQLTECLP